MPAAAGGQLHAPDEICRR